MKIVKKKKRPFKVICLDYSQLEIRVMAMRCGDKNMAEILCDPNGDIHQKTAEVFNVSRNPTAKQLNFLLLYGGKSYMLSEKLTSEGVPTTVQQASAYIQGYDSSLYPGVREYRMSLLQEYRENGKILYMTGRERVLEYPVYWNNDRSVHATETVLANNSIQGDGQDFLKASIIRCDFNCINPDASVLRRRAEIKKLWRKQFNMVVDSSFFDAANRRAKELDRIRLFFKRASLRWVLQVHDESNNFAKTEHAERCARTIARVMAWPHFLPPAVKRTPIPLGVEGGIADNWGDAKKNPEKQIVHLGDLI